MNLCLACREGWPPDALCCMRAACLQTPSSPSRLHLTSAQSSRPRSLSCAHVMQPWTAVVPAAYRQHLCAHAQVAGGLLLFQGMRCAPMQHMVYFSSVSATLGNAGQAAYAGANAVLNSTAAESQSQVSMASCSRGHKL